MIKFHTVRHIPEGSKQVRRFGLEDAVVYVSGSAGKFIGKGFSGKRNKPDFFFSFRTEAARAEHIRKYFDGLVAMRKYRAEQKATTAAKLLAGHGFVDGDIVYTSWGYDQTNVDFFQVTDASSPRSVKLRKIREATTDTTFMSGTTIGIKDDFCGEEFRAIFTANGIKCDGHHASKWDGQPKHFSTYA